MVKICDLAKASTIIPENFVRVIPDRTELPMLTRTRSARLTLLSPGSTAKARVMWLQNSTLMPTAMTRLTRETALSVISHQYIRLPRLTRMQIIMMMIKRRRRRRKEI